VVAQLTQTIAAYKQTHPGEDFALLHHRESTLVRRFEALVFAPLLGIDASASSIPTSIAQDAAWPGLSKLDIESVSGATGARGCRRDAAACAGRGAGRDRSSMSMGI